MPIPSEVAAMVLFKADRTCCVCRVKGKPVQIHHIDGNKRHNQISNLAILCLDCHADTQTKGGFHRKLSPELVTLYRDSWQKVVEEDRIKTTLYVLRERPKKEQRIEILTSIIDDLKERKQNVLLAMVYNNIGNKKLRDKYIEKAISESCNPSTLIFLRSLQGKANSINSDVIEKEIKRREKNKDWSQLARLYVDIGKWKEAVSCYCKDVSNSIEQGNTFSAAYYLKEMSLEEKLYKKLFQIALKEASDRKDLWWQVRALQELGSDSELNALLKLHEKEIKQSKDPTLLALLYRSLNDEDHYAETVGRIFKGTEFKKVKSQKSE